jgi:hypothetical protein
MVTCPSIYYTSQKIQQNMNPEPIYTRTNPATANTMTTSTTSRIESEETVELRRGLADRRHADPAAESGCPLASCPLSAGKRRAGAHLGHTAFGEAVAEPQRDVIAKKRRHRLVARMKGIGSVKSGRWSTARRLCGNSVRRRRWCWKTLTALNVGTWEEHYLSTDVEKVLL